MTPETELGAPSNTPQIQQQSVQQIQIQKQPPKPYVSTAEIASILKKLGTDKSFTAGVEAYGRAIAASIIEKSQATPDVKLNFEEETRKIIEFQGGSYALIYKGLNIPGRISPFIWQLDQQTRRMWSVFTFNNFYGHKDSKKPWKRLQTAIIVSPYNNTTNMVDSFGKGSLAKYDEATQFQMPLTVTDTSDLEQMRAMNKQFLSAALTVYMELAEYLKPKMNMKLIMGIILVAAVIVVGYFAWPTISHIFSNILPH